MRHRVTRRILTWSFPPSPTLKAALSLSWSESSLKVSKFTSVQAWSSQSKSSGASCELRSGISDNLSSYPILPSNCVYKATSSQQGVLGIWWQLFNRQASDKDNSRKTRHTHPRHSFFEWHIMRAVKQGLKNWMQYNAMISKQGLILSDHTQEVIRLCWNQISSLQRVAKDCSRIKAKYKLQSN